MTCAPTAPGVAESASSSASGVTQCAISKLRVELRLHESRAQAGHDQAVDGARVSCALHHDLVSEVDERKARNVVALRRAVQEEPRPARAPGLGGELLGLLPRRRLRPEVDPLDQRRDVELQRAVAERVAQLRIRARPALVPRHVEAPGPAGRVGAQRVEVGRFGLDQPSLCRSAATASAGVSNPSTPSRSQLPRPTTGLPVLRANAISDSVPHSPADRDHAVRCADDERVARLAHAGRDGDGEPGVPVAPVGRREAARASSRRPRERPSTRPPSRHRDRRSRRRRPPRRAAARPPPPAARCPASASPAPTTAMYGCSGRLVVLGELDGLGLGRRRARLRFAALDAERHARDRHERAGEQERRSRRARATRPSEARSPRGRRRAARRSAARRSARARRRPSRRSGACGSRGSISARLRNVEIVTSAIPASRRSITSKTVQARVALVAVAVPVEEEADEQQHRADRRDDRARIDTPRAQPSASLKPWRQLFQRGSQPSSRLAFALVAPCSPVVM